jgi:hypothetical protein
MDSQMGSHDAVPILYRKAFADRQFPRLEQDLGYLSPCGIKTIQQLIGGEIQGLATRPAPMRSFALIPLPVFPSMASLCELSCALLTLHLKHRIKVHMGVKPYLSWFLDK